MSKSRKNIGRRHNKKSSGFFNKVKKTSKSAIPVVKSGLNKVGNTVKSVAVKSEPVIKESFNKLYGYVKTGMSYTSNAIKKGIKKTRKRK
ncbi:MAG: hypothetical protein WCI04_01715 [archaeon]